MKARDAQFIFQFLGCFCRQAFAALHLKLYVGFPAVSITVVRQYGQGFYIVHGFSGHGFCRYGTAQIHVSCGIIIRYCYRRRSKCLVFALCRRQHGCLVRTHSGSRKIAPGVNRCPFRYVDLSQPVAGKDCHPCINAVRRVVVQRILNRICHKVRRSIRIGGQSDIAIGLQTAFHVRHRTIGKFHDPHGNDRDRRSRTLPFFLDNISLKP